MADLSKNKPKILIFSLAYAPFVGGAEIAVQEITWQLGLGEFEFDLVTCNLDGKQEDEEQVTNIKVYRVGKGIFGKFFFPWLAYKKAIELHQKNNYSIIWSIMANRAGLAALKFKEKFPEVKYLLTLQEGDPISHVYWRTWFWWWRYKKIYQSADHIQVISKWLERRAKKFGFKGKIEVVPNGMEINSIINKDRLKKELNIEKDDRVILTTSRLVKKNGVDNLIQAFKLLVTQYSLLNTKLLIVGGGPLEDNLKKIVKEFKPEDKIIFTGEVINEKALEYYQIADVFCRPSLSEGLGNSFLEAMAAGVPVIATPVGGIPDFLKEEETGWFCEPKNPESIAEKIQYVLDEKNKNEVARVVANAKKMVAEKYTWEIVASQMKKIFEKLL